MRMPHVNLSPMTLVETFGFDLLIRLRAIAELAYILERCSGSRARDSQRRSGTDCDVAVAQPPRFLDLERLCGRPGLGRLLGHLAGSTGRLVRRCRSGRFRRPPLHEHRARCRVQNLSSRGGAIFGLETNMLLDDCTIAENLASEGAAIYFDDGAGTVVLEHSIVAGDGGDLFRCGGGDGSAQTTCIWDGAGGWPDCLPGLEGVWGNYAHDPLFCGAPGREFHLQPTSPCAARSEPGRGVIGAWPVGCSREMVALERASLALRAEVDQPLVHPNPFRSSTELAYALTGEEWVRVEIFDISGRRVATLFDGQGAPGAHSLTWDGKEESGLEARSGPYFARIQTPNATRTVQVLRLR